MNYIRRSLSLSLGCGVLCLLFIILALFVFKLPLIRILIHFFSFGFGSFDTGSSPFVTGLYPLSTPLFGVLPHKTTAQEPQMGKKDAKPRGRMSAYAYFVQTCREEHKKKHPNENVVFAEFSKKCAERWKVCSQLVTL